MLPVVVIIPPTVSPIMIPARPGGARLSTARPMITSISTKVPIASARIAWPIPIPGNGAVAPSPPISTASGPVENAKRNEPSAAPTHCATM